MVKFGIMKFGIVVVLLGTLATLKQVNGVIQIGEFNGQQGITGIVRFTSSSTIVIENFSFNGEPPETFLYFFSPGTPVSPTGGGTIIPVQGDFATNAGGFRSGTPITNIELTAELTGNDVCDIGTLTMWCRTAREIFVELVVPRAAFEQDGSDPCTLRSPRVIVGEFPAGDHSITGTVQFTSPTTVVIDDLSFDGNAPATFIYSFPPGLMANGQGSGGSFLRIPTELDFVNGNGGFIEGNVVTNQDVTIELSTGTVCDIGTITLWCSVASALFSVLAVPSSSYILGDDNSCSLGVETAQVVAGLLPAGDHSIGGLVRFTSPTTIFIEDFTFDGRSPDTFLYFFAPGVTADPTGGGTIIPLTGDFTNNEGGIIANREVPVQDVVVELPTGTDVCDIGILTLWCRTAEAIFTQLPISLSLFASTDPCQLKDGVIVAGFLDGPVHAITGEVQILSTTRLFIKDFNFDGQSPDTFVYSYGPGVTVDPSGAGGQTIPIEASFANDQGGFTPFTRVTDADLTIDLSDINMCDIGTLTLWCRTAREIFVELKISRNIFVNDGANPCTLSIRSQAAPPPVSGTFENCLPLDDNLQLSWTVDRTNNVTNFMICGCQGVDPSVLQYMGFGASRNVEATSMDEADPIIAWVDNNGVANAVDYHLQSRTQCRNGEGVCPDVQINGRSCTNDVMNVSGRITNRQQCVSYTRSFTTNDSTCDVPLNPDNQQLYIVWGIGGLGDTAFKHFSRANFGDPPIHLGRDPLNECRNQLSCGACDPFQPQEIIGRDTTFRASIGPAGNERGYMGITGRPGWGISWYINGILIPKLVLLRNRTYTFIVEGGSDSTDSGNYHPFYITDSIEGGRIRNTAQERQAETVYAGFDENDNPTGVGRLCRLRETMAARTSRENCEDLNAYLEALSEPECVDGEPGMFTWTPDVNTPDLVYYQCATHLNLGYQISVVDELPPSGQIPTTPTTILVLLFVALATFY